MRKGREERKRDGKRKETEKEKISREGKEKGKE